MKKIGIIFGGIGNEAEISILSAINVFSNLDRKKYIPKCIYWDKSGNFFLEINPNRIKKNKQVFTEDFSNLFDVAFLATHGKFGEDGTLQAILEANQLKYTGCGIMSSSLCMDKCKAKQIALAFKIIQTSFTVLDYQKMNKDQIDKEIKSHVKKYSFPIFVKPSNSGSSIGITKVSKILGLNKAIAKARIHDQKIVLEKALNNPREIEVGIIGNSNLIISPCGELKLENEFYDFEKKYITNSVKAIIPAVLTKAIGEKIRSLAMEIYKIYDCKGFARIDFFVQNGKIYFNEINTLPGFTNISMFPQLMRASGISYKSLITKIIELA